MSMLPTFFLEKQKRVTNKRWTSPGQLRYDGLALKIELKKCGCSSMVEHQPSKLNTRVRFPSPAPMGA